MREGCGFGLIAVRLDFSFSKLLQTRLQLIDLAAAARVAVFGIMPFLAPLILVLLCVGNFAAQTGKFLLGGAQLVAQCFEFLFQEPAHLSSFAQAIEFAGNSGQAD